MTEACTVASNKYVLLMNKAACGEVEEEDTGGTRSSRHGCSSVRINTQLDTLRVLWFSTTNTKALT